MKSNNSHRCFLCLLIFSLLLTACTQVPPAESKNPESESFEESVIDTEGLARQLEAAYSELIEDLKVRYNRREVSPSAAMAYNAFAKEMTKAWYQSGNTSNSVISPYSMYELLAMLSEITDETCRADILQILGCSNDWDLDSELVTMERAVKVYYEMDFSSSNSLWLDTNTEFNEDEVSAAEDRFSAEIHRLDLSEAASEARINRWIAEKTNRQSEEMDENQAGDANPAKQAVLVNALYFEDAYVLGHGTANIEFHNADGTTKQTQGICLSEILYLYRNERFTCARVIIGAESILTVLMPAEGVTITADDEEALEFLLGNPDQFKLASVNVSIPFFRNESTSEDSEKILKIMGLDSLFEQGALEEFIIGEKGAQSFLQISQSAMTSLSETGVQASAATRADMYSGVPELKDENLVIDHPFLFALSLGDCVLTVGSVDKL